MNTDSKNQAIIHVPFHETELFIIEHGGIPFTPMRPIVEGMGLAWKPQFVKLKEYAERYAVTQMVTQVPGDDQTRSVTCIPLRKLFGWMMSVHPKKVKPEIYVCLVSSVTASAPRTSCTAGC